ncbi:MAG: aldo/keto reductase, partial [Burkholderiaceae bacterium]
IGLTRGASTEESVALIREAIDLGVYFLDNAENYGTESIVGKALAQVDRSAIVVSTKTQVRKNGAQVPAEQIMLSIDLSLQRLATDYIDIFNLHGVSPEDYDYALNELAPVLVKAKQAGKIRHIGITETSPRDPEQNMLHRAVQEEPWEVVMLAFNMMNQGASHKILPITKQRGIGTLIMFAVRNVFSQPDTLRKTLQSLAASGQIPPELALEDNPLESLVRQAGAYNVTDAAYRFARHQPGADVVLFGTGNRAHLATNINSINSPPLKPAAVENIHALFARLLGVGLDLPDRMESAS